MPDNSKIETASSVAVSRRLCPGLTVPPLSVRLFVRLMEGAMNLQDQFNKACRIARIKIHITKILNTDYPDEDRYWQSIGQTLALLNDRIRLILEGKA